jgi:hypothetical protein
VNHSGLTAQLNSFFAISCGFRPPHQNFSQVQQLVDTSYVGLSEAISRGIAGALRAKAVRWGRTCLFDGTRKTIGRLGAAGWPQIHFPVLEFDKAEILEIGAEVEIGPSHATRPHCIASRDAHRSGPARPETSLLAPRGNVRNLHLALPSPQAARGVIVSGQGAFGRCWVTHMASKAGSLVLSGYASGRQPRKNRFCTLLQFRPLLLPPAPAFLSERSLAAFPNCALFDLALLEVRFCLSQFFRLLSFGLCTMVLLQFSPLAYRVLLLPFGGSTTAIESQ